jgi:predicted nucleic acid-binding protein
VFVYDVSTADAAKQARAREWIGDLWARRRGRTSFQVLAEFYSTVTQKLTPPVAPPWARQTIDELVAWRPVSIDETVLGSAFDVQDRYAVSFWDSLIVAAARAARCSVLLTEDLQDGQDLDGLIVVNPFRHRPDSI